MHNARVIGGLIAATITVALAAGCTSETPAASVPPTVPASGPCAGIAVVDPGNPPPSFALTSDPALEAQFPLAIDGQPLTDLTSARAVESLCLLGGQDSVTAFAAQLPAGMDAGEISVASASVEVDSLPVTITAFRVPDGLGAALLPALGPMTQAIGGTPRFDRDVQQVTVAGRPAWSWVNPTDGSHSYLYAVGDTLFVLDDATELQAGEILAALP